MASRSWNRVELIGNLTRDPEMRYTPTGAAVVTFSIATNRTYVTDGERREEADFHRCVAWNKLAELCSQLLKKGNRVFVSGRLQNRSWEGQDGQSRNITEIVIEDMLLLTSRNSGEYEADTSSGSANDMPIRQAASIPQSSSTNPPADEVSPIDDLTVAEAEEKKEEKKEEKPETPKKEDPGDLDDLPF